MDANDRAEFNSNIPCFRSSVLGEHGPYNPFAGTGSQRGRICNGGPCARCGILANNKKAFTYKLHRYTYCYHHAADPLCNIHRELSELFGTRRYRTHAVARLSCNRCGKGYGYLSSLAFVSGYFNQRYHPCF